MNHATGQHRQRPRRKVLVTGAGTGRANNLVRSLTAGGNDIEVIGCHSDRFVLAKSTTDWRFHAPSPSSGADFISTCRPIVEANGIEAESGGGGGGKGGKIQRGFIGFGVLPTFGLGGGSAGDGGEVEVREEEDELLRAAEELGIDLSPGSLRAAARPPTAEEVEEGQERVDQDGELALPADEALEDLDDVELAPEEAAEEEAEAQAGPLAEEIADLELED